MYLVSSNASHLMINKQNLNEAIQESNSSVFADERPRDDDGRGAGVRDPADDDRQAAVRPGGQDHRPSRGLVLRPPVHRLQGRSHLDQAV